MNENLFFVAFVLGALISLSLILRLIKGDKANFFLALVIAILSLEMLFSWGAHSGYNNHPDSFPIHLTLNYLLIPPSLWLFIKLKTDGDFQIRKWHYLLFLPALLESVLQILSFNEFLQLSTQLYWTFLTEYLPLMAYCLVIATFWLDHFRKTSKSKQEEKHISFSNIRFLILMSTLSMLAIVWLAVTFVNWNYFWIVEYLLTILFISLAFIAFLESQNFPLPKVKIDQFEQYNDEHCLAELDKIVESKELYLNPILSLSELAKEINLPKRYVSYLINSYHQKNFKEYINQYRINTFLKKANDGELKKKTLLALALESGFNSKSSFNQVFKNHTGKTPSQYLKP